MGERLLVGGEEDAECCICGEDSAPAGVSALHFLKRFRSEYLEPVLPAPRLSCWAASGSNPFSAELGRREREPDLVLG